MEEESPRRPQTRGEQTTCVTLSRVEGRVGIGVRGGSILSWTRRSMATDVGEAERENTSRREFGGNCGDAHEGGAGWMFVGVGCVAVALWEGCRESGCGVGGDGVSSGVV